jgi:ribosomal protein S18 acetylase RimI-like enzyme
MVCEAPITEFEGPPIVPLGQEHRAAILELAALVYPHYFRTRTPELGPYFGILDEGRLAAMVGERMAVPGCTEVSAVCTHPNWVGRGLARRLLAFVTNDLLRQGELAFLHVSEKNVRAKQLYEQNGYRTRREVGFWSLKRGAK